MSVWPFDKIVSSKKLMFKYFKNSCKNGRMGFFWEDYRVAAISTINLTVIGINMPCLKSVGQFNHAFIEDLSYPLRTY